MTPAEEEARWATMPIADLIAESRRGQTFAPPGDPRPHPRHCRVDNCRTCEGIAEERADEDRGSLGCAW